MKQVGCFVLSVISAAMLAACAHHSSPAPAFSEKWTWELERLEPKPQKRPEGIVLGGEDAPVKSGIYVDEQGRPRFLIGDPENFNAELDVSSDDVGIELNYTRNWGKNSKLPHLPEQTPERAVDESSRPAPNAAGEGSTGQ